MNIIVCYRCAVRFDVYTILTPTNAPFIKLEKVLKFTLICLHFDLLLHLDCCTVHFVESL